MAINNVKFV